MLDSQSIPERIDVGVAAQRTNPDDGDAILLDVREQDEWTAGHAPNAVLLPLSLLDAGAPLPNDALGRLVFVICRSGHRSQLAAHILRERGTEAADVIGGMMAWAHAGHSVVDDQGGSGSIA